MSEQSKQERDDSGDSTGDWVRIYRQDRGHQEWNPDHRNTTDPYGGPRTKQPVVKKATKRHPYTTDFEDTVLETATELVDLLVRKHKAYGPKNISQAPGSPENGLRVRMWDKMARLNHILDHPGTDTGDEALEDTIKDLANYCIIFLLVRRGQWPTK